MKKSRSTLVKLPLPCKTHKANKLAYIAFFDDAEKRDKEGQKQIQCPDCKYFFWPDEY